MASNCLPILAMQRCTKGKKSQGKQPREII